MKIHAKKALSVLAISTLVLAGCSSDKDSKGANGSGDSKGGKITLSVWSSQEDQDGSDGWLQSVEKKFEEAHPDYDITWKNSVVGADQAATTVNQDPSAAADVYVYANDRLGSLLDSGSVGELSDASMKQLSEQAEDTIAASVKGQDGKAYGLPIEPNTWFMYYNKAKLNQEDIKSFDTMLSKAKVSFPMSNSWYYPAFYAGAGASFFGKDGLDEKAGIKLGDKAGEVTKYLTSVVKNPNFVNDSEGSGIGGLANGSVDVVFSGSWYAKNIKKALGDNYGVASLPTFKLDGQDVQMKAFSGSKAIAYNPNTKNPKAASEFAAFLASTESQKSHFDKNGVIPADKSLAKDAAIAADPVAVALFETVSNASILQPTLKPMTDFWDPATTFGKALVNGEVNSENAVAKTDAWTSSFSKK
ncbi:ABC transporter substrate-binding protein [Corynebacterium pseudotuberculosis]|uniref:extracellular solute-binding protein n=1 Tax=Corynebacterium pseudotuberculosis TaxID=1719 RepID=UPI000737B69E|nr:extracellular solute-binding protein [Corynebacterium pseudotuberculosis]ALU20961.1 ABC transporter substrate-binding protein [Corynebacterium pseudotuberculosis]